MKCFSVFDSAAQAYLPPFYSKTTGLALRSFETAANNAEHDFHNHAGDYTLFELGSFDESTAYFTPLKAPLNLGTALTLLFSERE